VKNSPNSTSASGSVSSPSMLCQRPAINNGELMSEKKILLKEYTNFNFKSEQSEKQAGFYFTLI
jgi:hypothetical protein